jgi:hypothetical protein
MMMDYSPPAPSDPPRLSAKSTPVGRTEHFSLPLATADLTAGHEPSRAWRIVRMTFGVLGILALLEAIVIMTFALALAGSVASRLHNATPPAPVVTGCPFGPDSCGG